MKARNLEEKNLATSVNAWRTLCFSDSMVIPGPIQTAYITSFMEDQETLETRGLQLVWVKTDLSEKDEVQRSSSLGNQDSLQMSYAFCVNEGLPLTQQTQNNLTKQKPNYYETNLPKHT